MCREPDSQAEWFTEQEMRRHYGPLLAAFNLEQEAINEQQQQAVSSDEDMDSLNVQDFSATEPAINNQQVVHQLFMQRQPQTQAQTQLQDAGALSQPQTQSQSQAHVLFMQQQPQTQPHTQAPDASMQQQPQTQQPSQAQAALMQQQPQTQAPTLSPAQPAVSAVAEATRDAQEPVRARQQILHAYQRQVQSTHRVSQPPPLLPAQPGPRIVNGLSSSMWDNCNLVRNAAAPPGAGAAQSGGGMCAANPSPRRAAARTWGMQDTGTCTSAAK